MMDQDKYPIGLFKKPKSINAKLIKSWIADLTDFPSQIATLTQSLTTEQLRYQYRDGGWTIAQIVHHCGDSHTNSYIRFKLALTEDNPKIKPYEESLWAELFDSSDTDILLSLQLITALHAKLVALLSGLSSDDMERSFVHPEHHQTISIKENIGIYAWHCRHHLAHIKRALEIKIIE